MNFIKKLEYFENIIFYDQSFINGNIFYAIEYLEYLRFKEKLDFKLVFRIPNISFSKVIFKLWEEKYNEKINELKDSVYFTINKPIISKNTLILDGQSIYNKLYQSKNIIYNWGDHSDSLNKKFSNQKICTIGDKEIFCNVDYHFPLKLNFNLFKDIKISKGIYTEDKRDNNDSGKIYKRKRNIKNFHETFNELIYLKDGFWERANRLIPECKFYSKKINFFNYDVFLDSADLRNRRSWEKYDLYSSNFGSFIKEKFNLK